MGASLVVLDSSSDDVYNQHIIASSLALSRPLGSTSTKPDLERLPGPSRGGTGSRVTATPTPNQRDTKKTRLRFRMLGIAFFWHNYGCNYVVSNSRTEENPNMRRLEAEWLDYRRAVIPANAVGVQVTECRRAFYAGAAAIHAVIMRMLTPGAEATDEDVRKMQELYQELVEFGQSVKAERTV